MSWSHLVVDVDLGFSNLLKCKQRRSHGCFLYNSGQCLTTTVHWLSVQKHSSCRWPRVQSRAHLSLLSMSDTGAFCLVWFPTLHIAKQNTFYNQSLLNKNAPIISVCHTVFVNEGKELAVNNYRKNLNWRLNNKQTAKSWKLNCKRLFSGNKKLLFNSWTPNLAGASQKFLNMPTPKVFH